MNLFQDHRLQSRRDFLTATARGIGRKVLQIGTFRWFAGGALVAVLGCGGDSKLDALGPLVPVQGKVTLGGQPLVGGRLELYPALGDPNVARFQGTIDAQGNYFIETNGKEGAPAGKYRAAVWTGGDDKNQESQFDSIYSHWEKTPLVIVVTENALAGQYDLKIKPRAKGR
jgi:hypothetical protein